MPRASLHILFAVAFCTLGCSGGCSGNEKQAPPPSPRPSAASAPAAATPAPAPTPSSGCLGDEGGCRAKMLSFLPCDGEVALPQVTLEQLFADPQSRAGKPLALVGPLVKRGAECTEGECERTCCNTCVSVVTIGDPDSSRYVRLVSAETPGLYLCRGDESLLCCQFPTDGQTVVAQGTFQMTSGLSPPVYQLFANELCTP